MKKYNHNQIEKKWQKIWEKVKPWSAKDEDLKNKYYSLIEFPYPSGDGLHVGHVRSNTAMDIISRKRRMEGYNVLYPIGWDAFGLPTENYAIKTGVAPDVATKKNTTNFRRQLKSLGFSFDWDREINTTDPNYYKWTQWLFLKFFEHGLAYKSSMPINWCPHCKIGLANEEAVGGKCDRCGGQTEKKNKEQWMLKITAYAEKLLTGLDNVDFLPEIKLQQKNWIGKSEGALLKFKILNLKFQIEVFTTRPDTLFGATYLVLAPEHSLLENKELGIRNYGEIEKYIENTKNKTNEERQVNKEKTGVELKGVKAINPATKEEIPIWVANYVLGGYGTGAIMAVPAHDERDREFAKKFNLPIVDRPLADKDEIIKKVSGEKKIQYKLHDWVFSRQRYWGEPIPLINCSKCGWVAVPEKDLPVKLPKVKNYQPRDDGQSPLASVESWVNVKCPKCNGSAKRETDTMPNWAGSSWYYLAYSLGNKESGIKNQGYWNNNLLKYWLPVDWYNGGMEHVTLHLLYSRFWNIFLHDIGLVPYSEPYKKRTAHGLILAEGGVKMSKSKGNIINPDTLVEQFGADSLRLYEMFLGPFNQATAWDPRGIVGVYRFLNRVWNLLSLRASVSERDNLKESKKIASTSPRNDGLTKLLHQTIKKVSEDIESMHFNTAISSLMIFLGEIESAGESQITKDILENFLKLLFPFAPHITQELWEKLDNESLLDFEKWPEWDEKLIIEEEFNLIVQVNGKLRGTILVKKNISQEEAEKIAKANPQINKWLSGKISKLIFVPSKLINFLID